MGWEASYSIREKRWGALKPKSLSASALNTANLCLSRYEAENIIRAARVENDAAGLGTACHGALERYIKHIKFDKPGTPQDFQLLVMFFHVSFGEVFGGFEPSDPRYKDGLKMLKAWFERTDLSETEVISCEVKSSFPVKTSIGSIPFNYIWDRCDRTGKNEITVIDYKSSQFNVTPDDLKDKIQARSYGLAAQIQFPEAERIWVKFDMLRHDVVGTVFTKEENRETYKFIRNLAERIITTTAPKETLNDECRFCVKRQSCGAVNSNANVGGLAGLFSADSSDLAELRGMIDFQIKALKQNLGAIDTELMKRAKSDDVLSIAGSTNDALIGVSRRRAVDADRIRLIVGDDVFLKYGGVDLGIGQFDQMLKDPDIDAATKAQMKGMVYYNTGEPYIKTKKRSAFDA
jgi:hypothetical protein